MTSSIKWSKVTAPLFFLTDMTFVSINTHAHTRFQGFFVFYFSHVIFAFWYFPFSFLPLVSYFLLSLWAWWIFISPSYFSLIFTDGYINRLIKIFDFLFFIVLLFSSGWWSIHGRVLHLYKALVLITHSSSLFRPSEAFHNSVLLLSTWR